MKTLLAIVLLAAGCFGQEPAKAPVGSTTVQVGSGGETARTAAVTETVALYAGKPQEGTGLKSGTALLNGTTMSHLVMSGRDGKMLLQISLTTGEVVFGEGVTPSEAAKEFAAELRKIMAAPSPCVTEPSKNGK